MKNNNGSTALGFLIYAMILIFASVVISSISFPTKSLNSTSVTRYLESIEGRY